MTQPSHEDFLFLTSNSLDDFFRTSPACTDRTVLYSAYRHLSSYFQIGEMNHACLVGLI